MHCPTCHSPYFISHVLFRYIYGLLLAYKMPCYNGQFQINIILTNQSHECVLYGSGSSTQNTYIISNVDSLGAKKLKYINLYILLNFYEHPNMFTCFWTFKDAILLP